jgi:tetraacyldisaccharide 4'-kinase
MSLRALLAPVTPLYRLGLALRERRLRSGHEPIRRLSLPVISIGNLSTGGTGKTPLAIALARALIARGVAVDVLSRGYGRTGRDAARVDPAGSAQNYGDEPMLIARSAGVPVFVAPERYAAGLLAESEMKAQGVAVHLLDDGFQHRQLHRDIDILLLCRADLHDRLLPAGNLREPISALRRAHVLAIPAEDPALESDLRSLGWEGPTWRLRRRMEIPPVPGPVVAFCGIARPEQFFAGLESACVRLAARRAFRDHHRYTQAELERLASQARATAASALLTTEKDAVRLEGLRAPMPIHTVALVTEIADAPAALEWMLTRLPQLR